jgi:hypothetical protein
MYVNYSLKRVKHLHVTTGPPICLCMYDVSNTDMLIAQMYRIRLAERPDKVYLISGSGRDVLEAGRAMEPWIDGLELFVPKVKCEFNVTTNHPLSPCDNIFAI